MSSNTKNCISFIVAKDIKFYHCAFTPTQVDKNAR